MSLRCFVVAMVIALAPVPAVGQPVRLRATVAAVVLDLPQAEAAVSGTVRSGEVLEVLDEREGWYLVRPAGASLQDWRTGWIGRQLVEPMAIAAAVQRPGAPGTARLPDGSTDRLKFEFAAAGGSSFGLSSLADGLTEAMAEGARLGGLRNVQVDEGSALRWLAGGHVGVGVTPNLVVVGEVARTRLSNQSVSGTAVGQSLELGLSTTLTEYTGGVHYLLTRRRTTPYLAAGMGLVRLAASVGAGSLDTAIGVSESDTTWNVGGGLRMVGRSGWGALTDVRFVRIPDKSFVRVSGGLVFQVR